MLGNYLTIAWRNLIKNKVLSLINIGGLAVGMAVVMLISLWILDEVSFDKYHSNYNRIAQVLKNANSNGDVKTSYMMPFPLAAELRKSYGSDFKSVVMSTDPRDYILVSRSLPRRLSHFCPGKSNQNRVRRNASCAQGPSHNREKRGAAISFAGLPFRFYTPLAKNCYALPTSFGLPFFPVFAEALLRTEKKIRNSYCFSF